MQTIYMYSYTFAVNAMKMWFQTTIVLGNQTESLPTEFGRG